MTLKDEFEKKKIQAEKKLEQELIEKARPRLEKIVNQTLTAAIATADINVVADYESDVHALAEKYGAIIPMMAEPKAEIVETEIPSKPEPQYTPQKSNKTYRNNARLTARKLIREEGFVNVVMLAKKLRVEDRYLRTGLAQLLKKEARARGWEPVRKKKFIEYVKPLPKNNPLKEKILKLVTLPNGELKKEILRKEVRLKLDCVCTDFNKISQNMRSLKYRVSHVGNKETIPIRYVLDDSKESSPNS